MKNCIFVVLIVSISSNIIGSENKNIIGSHNQTSKSDSQLIIPKLNAKKKKYSTPLSNTTTRLYNSEDIKKRLIDFEIHKDIHKATNRDEFNQILRNRPRSNDELNAIVNCKTCFKIIQKNPSSTKRKMKKRTVSNHNNN